MLKKVLFAVLMTTTQLCIAQTSPNLYQGQVPTVTQWNSYFTIKQDYIAPGTSGNVLTSNGTANWTSAAPAPAKNLAGGTTNAIPYQSSANNTTFLSQGTGLLQENAGVPSWLAFGTSVNNPGTGTIESLLPVQTLTGTSHAFVTADFFQKTRRSNSGAAMTDTFPASTATGLANGTLINVVNYDSTASDTVTAGSGTTIGGNSTFVIQPGRDVWWTYDATNTTWRAIANTASSLILSGTAATASQLYGGSSVAGDATAISVGSGCTLSAGTLSCAGTGTGTVTSVAMSVPSWLSVSGSPVTSSGTLAVTAATGQTQNEFLATPNGSSGAVSLRSIVAADLPTATTSALGVMEVGTGLSVSSGIVTPTFGTGSNQVVQGGVITAAGPTGSATVAPIITYNAAGQLTTVSSATITPAVGSITGLGTGVSTALGDNVGIAGAFVVNGGALGTPSSGTLTNATGLPLSGLTSQSANTLVGALTATTPSALSVPSCSTSASALLWTSGTGFSCNTSISASSASTATSIAGGTTGNLMWQAAANTTAFVANGSANNVLQSNGTSAPSWTSTPTITGTNFTSIPLSTAVTGTLPVANGGTGATSAQGNGSKVQLSTGTTTSGDCVKFDANGNTVDAGAACGGGGGSTAWSSLTAPTASNSVTATVDTSQTLNGHFDSSAGTNQALMAFGEDSASAKASYVLALNTLSGSLAEPLNIGVAGTANVFYLSNYGSLSYTGPITTGLVFPTTVSLTAGANHSTSHAGGLATITGGSSAYSSQGGGAQLVGGANSSTGQGGPVAITGGTSVSNTGGLAQVIGGASTSGTGGGVLINSGAGATSGAITIDVGVGSSAQGAITVGSTQATSITIGNSGSTTTLNGTVSFTNPIFLTATSASVGGSVLAAGACSSTTTAVTGVTTSMVVHASPNTYPGDGNYWLAYVSSSGNVTVKVCATIAGTPTASTYNIAANAYP